MGWKRYLLVALVAVCVAIAASYVTRILMDENRQRVGELHALMHEQIDLDPEQERLIDQLEADFEDKRKLYEARLRAANNQLAQAIASEHEYGPRVAEAVDQSHMAMGDLQKETLAHVFSMRAVLRPDQAAQFDEKIAATLTDTPDR